MHSSRKARSPRGAFKVSIGKLNERHAVSIAHALQRIPSSEDSDRPWSDRLAQTVSQQRAKAPAPHTVRKLNITVCSFRCPTPIAARDLRSGAIADRLWTGSRDCHTEPFRVLRKVKQRTLMQPLSGTPYRSDVRLFKKPVLRVTDRLAGVPLETRQCSASSAARMRAAFARRADPMNLRAY